MIKILYGLIGAAIALGIIGGIGSTCVAWDSSWWTGKLAIVASYHLIFKLVYILTWASAIGWIIAFWALKTRKPWFYQFALINNIAALSGLLKVVILFMGGMAFAPANFRMIVNIAILVLLLVPQYKSGILQYIEEGTDSSSSSKNNSQLFTQMINLSYFLIGFGFVLLFQPFVMDATHVIDGINIAISYGYLLATGFLQLYVGIFSILIGLVMQIVSRYAINSYSIRVAVTKN